MLLESYRKEIIRPECRPEAQSVQCIAHLDQDISEVIPYLNSVFGGFQYIKDPPCVTFRVHGKLIAVHSKKICVNALKDESEGEKIIEWLKREVNETWERRGEIVPSFEGAPKPKVMEILKLLPRTNCRECGRPTCMVFAVQVAEGGKGADDCPPLEGEGKVKLDTYLRQFAFE
ncbi:MAG: (Fe-S)-binding protein [Syntrophobacteraceae bacterium]|nr:(Fe-S)-binding protein [Syntrophobacteraceae bacterium]